MPTSLLSVVQDASDELGLPHPASVLSNADLTVIQLAALTRAAGDTLVKRRLWRMLLSTHTITTTTAEYYPLPDDYGRIIDNTTWDGTNHWPLDGPLLSQEWQYLTRGIVASGPRMQFRFSQNRVQVRPTPVVAGISLTFLYISKYWIYTVQHSQSIADIDRQAAFQLDSDLIAFDHRLIVDSVKLRFLQAKGFDTTAVAQDLQNSLDDAVAADTGAMKLNLAGGRLYYPLIGVQNIPDGNWP